MPEAPDIPAVREWLQQLQSRIVRDIEAIDGSATFLRDEWQREAGGGGISRVLKDGVVFEQAGVGFSHVTGNELPPSASASRPQLAGKPWNAMGVSARLPPAKSVRSDDAHERAFLRRR